MKISIITVSLNNAVTIEDTIRSVISQSYKDIEYIIIDGGSTDDTMEVVGKYKSIISKVVSEADNGIYDAMNKGIGYASGEVIGFLNADDYYCDNNVIEKIANEFNKYDVEGVYADLVYVKPDNVNRVVRYYSGANFRLSNFSSGWMPPHPTFFVKRECYNKYGLFKDGYKIAADFELLARFMYKYRINCRYLPETIVKMRIGGASTKNIKSNITLNREILRACQENDIKTNMFRIYLKYFKKSLQLFRRPVA